MTAAVTTAEVNRNVLALRGELTSFVQEVRTTTLRVDVYAAERQLLEQRISQLEADALAAAARADANRRLAVSGLVLPVLAAIIVAVLLAGVPT